MQTPFHSRTGRPRGIADPGRSAPVLALLGSLLLLGCATTDEDEVEQDVARLVAIGEYEEAVQLAAKLHEEEPDDALALSNYRRASAAWHLEQGRRAAFEGEDFEALDHFRDAREAAPEASEVNAWIAKMRDNLAERFLTEALEAHIKDDLSGAGEAYERVLQYRADDREAKQGLARVLLQLNYRQGMGDEYYSEGVRALSDYWLHEAKSRFGYVRKYVPESDRSIQRTEEVDELLADARVAIAEGLDREDRYAAARNEFRLALTLDPDHPEAFEGFERNRLEAEASDLLSRGHMQILRGEFEDAFRLLQEGRELSQRQDDLFDGALAELEQARFGRMYERARGFESDRDYEGAVVAYDELLEQAAYYEDAIARRRTLQSFIEDAQQLYDRAEATSDDAERASLLRQIRVFWPDYRDVTEQLEALPAPAAQGH